MPMFAKLVNSISGIQTQGCLIPKIVQLILTLCCQMNTLDLHDTEARDSASCPELCKKVPNKFAELNNRKYRHLGCHRSFLHTHKKSL